jgi:hypothetical protein
LRDFLIGLQSKLGSGNDNAAAMVTAHDIHCNLHKRKMRWNNGANRRLTDAQANASTVTIWRPL